jgi:methionyl-tRNA formyltransferase
MRVVFFGTADFGIPALNMVYQKHTLAAVVSTPPRQSGRGRKFVDSPVVLHSRSAFDGPVLTPESLIDPPFLHALREFNADCFIVVAFRLLPRQVFSLPRFGTINIHASLLPAYRGPAPIQRAIEAGEERTGVTVFRIDEGIDTGEILQQTGVAIGSDESTPQLYRRLSELGAETLDATLDAIEKGTCMPRVQDGGGACKAPKLKKNESIINWNQSAKQIFNKIRAYKPFPGTVTLAGTTRLGIEWGIVLPVSAGDRPCGSVVSVNDDSFDVQTGDGLLRVCMVKPEGRKIMSAGDYLRGTKLTKGFQFNE